MDKRRGKQIIYGFGFFAVFFLILAAVYFFWLRPEPTCFDGRRNQKEEKVDCGGPCVSCEIKSLPPLVVVSTKIFAADGGKMAAAEIKNPNSRYGADDFMYAIKIYSKTGEEISEIAGRSFIYPSEVKYIVEPISVGGDIGKAEVEFFGVNWRNEKEFSRPKIQLREIETKLRIGGSGVEISGAAINDNPFPVSKIRLIGFLANKNNSLVSVSKTEIDGFSAFEQKYFKIVFPKNTVLISGNSTSTPDVGGSYGKILADPLKTKIYAEAAR